MAFPEIVVLSAWKRSGGKCECERKGHFGHFNHIGKCGRALVFAKRGKEGVGGWEAHHINAAGGDVLENCVILCYDCHRQSPGG